MTFLELLLLAEANGEKILFQDVNSLITETHLYTRQFGSGEGWVVSTVPGKPEKSYTKSGDKWIWKRDEPTE